MTKPEKELLARMIEDKWDNALFAYSLASGMKGFNKDDDYDFVVLVKLKKRIDPTTKTVEEYLAEYQFRQRMKCQYEQTNNNICEGC